MLMGPVFDQQQFSGVGVQNLTLGPASELMESASAAAHGLNISANSVSKVAMRESIDG